MSNENMVVLSLDDYEFIKTWTGVDYERMANMSHDDVMMLLKRAALSYQIAIEEGKYT